MDQKPFVAKNDIRQGNTEEKKLESKIYATISSRRTLSS